MTTNKFSKYVIDNIVVGTPISSIIAEGASIGLDSAAVINLIDSDYVQQRETPGLDSAKTIALIDSDYVAARTPASNGAGLDSAATLDLLSYDIQEVGTNEKQVAISLNTFVDPFDQTATTNRSFNLNYTSSTGMFIRETGGRTEIQADASGTGQSTGLLLTGASFGNNGTEIAGNLKLSDLPTTDPMEAGLLWNDGGIPVFSGSTAPTGIDSADVIGIVDSAYVQARQTSQDFAYSSLTGAPTTLSSFTNDTNYITAADIPATVDSDYVQARVTLDGVGLDSAGVTALVDSDYVAARAPAGGGGLDSAGVQSLIDADLIGSGVNAVALGVNTVASTNSTVAIGYDADALGNQSVAIGENAYAGGINSVVMGHDANNSPAGNATVAIGFNAHADAYSAISIGQNASVTGSSGIAIGESVSASFEDAIAVGRAAVSSQADTIAMGTSSVASGSRSVAIGNGTDATGSGSVALGNSSQALATNAIAIGLSADTNANASSIAVGENTEISGAQGISIGANAAASQASVAVGTSASVTTGTNTTAVGPFAGATGSDALALGRGAKANADNTIVLAATGSNSIVATQFGIDIRTSAAGSLTYDTTNDWTFGATVNAPAFVGDGSGLTGLPSGGGLDSAATLDLIGFQNTTAGSSSIQITPDTSTKNGDNNNIIIGHGVSDLAGIGPNSVALGYDVGAQNSGISLGYKAGAGSQSTNTGGIFIGYQTNYFGNSNPANYAIAIGHEAGAVYPGVGSVALGKSAGAGSSGDYTVAIGYKANDTSSFENTIMIKADGSSSYNSTAQYDIDIRTSAAGSLTYDTTNDWTFGAGVTMTDLTASGATVIFSNLPTVDPVNAGQLWNSAGTLKVSAG